MRQLYKGFKKIAEDDDSAKLVHDDGHQLVISKRGLSKPLLSGLHELPLHQYDGTNLAPYAEFNKQQDQSQPYEKAPQEQVPAWMNAQPQGTVDYTSPEFKSLAQTWGSGEKIPQNVIDDLVRRKYPGFGSPSVQAPQHYSEAQLQESEKEISGAPKLNLPEAGTYQEPEQPQQTPAAQPRELGGLPDYSQFDQGNVPPQMAGLPGFEQAMGAYQQIGKAEQAEAQRQAQLYKSAADASRINQDLFNNSHQELQFDINDTLKRIESNEIRPNHYLENMSAGQKIAIAIGGLIAGAGAGVLHQENPVYKFLNAQIERDLGSQKANLENQNNLLSHLQGKYHNDLVAENMFRVMRAETLANEIAQAGANSKLSQAMPNAQLAQAKLMQMYMPFYQSAVAMNAYQKLGQAGAGQQLSAQRTANADQQAQTASMQAQQLLRAGMINEEQRKQIDQEIQEQYKAVHAHQEADRLIDAIGQQQTLGNRVFSPIQSKDKIAAYAATLFPLIQDADPSKRLTEETVKRELAPFIPGLFTSSSTRESFKQNAHELINRVTKYPSAAAAFPGLSMPKWNAPEAQLEYANGKYWRKVPGGRVEVRQAKVTQ